MNRRRAFFWALGMVSLGAYGACDNEPVTNPPPAGYVPTYPANYYEYDAGFDGAGEDSGEGDAGEDSATEDGGTDSAPGSSEGGGDGASE